MGHYCRMCAGYYANERFSGKGHSRHVCRACQRIPAAERFRLEALGEIAGYFLRQSRVSKKNRRRLEVLCTCDDKQVRDMATLALLVAKIHPSRHRRSAVLRAHHPDLWHGLVEAGLVHPPEPGVADSQSEEPGAGLASDECEELWALTGVEPYSRDAKVPVDDCEIPF